MFNNRKTSTVMSSPYLAWAFIFIVVPLGMIVYYGLTDDSGAFTFANIASIAQPEHLKALLLALELSLISTVICFLLAYPLGMMLAKNKMGNQGIITTLFILPMWMNFLLRTLAWMTLLENKGIINGVLSAMHLPLIHIINTPAAIVIGMVYNFLPFMILPIYNTIVKLDNSLTEAARDLGANERGAFLRVTVPLSMPGVISGISMVFLPAMTNYVVLDMLYNSTYIMGSLIGSYFAAYNWHGGSMISLVLLGIICVFTLLTDSGEDDVRTGGALL